MKTTEEKNRMIAEFMGARPITFNDGTFGFTYWNDGNKSGRSGCFPDGSTNVTEDNSFGQFHTSWDWLMPVLEKIRTTDLKGTILENGNIYSTYIAFPLTYSTEIYRVYDRVIEFIEWYNKQNHNHAGSNP